MELLVKPTEKIGLIIVVDMLILLVLGLVIIILHLAEKAEDARNKEAALDFW